MNPTFARALRALPILLAAACADGPTAPSAPPVPEANPLFFSSGTVWVTNENDGGVGSLRAAIARANTDSHIERIQFSPRVRFIQPHTPLVITASQALTIRSGGTTIDGGSLPALSRGLSAVGGGDLTLSGLTLQRAPAEGLVVAVPSTATGTQRVQLISVTAQDNGSHGILVNDQAEFFNDPESTSPDGSAASLDVSLLGVKSLRNGFTALDQDGIRLNEGGLGTLTARVVATTVVENGGDGVEFDERGDGDVQFSVSGSDFSRNGGFDAADYDDGIDIDEAGEGSILGFMLLTKVNNNFEQGIDLNENDAGDLKVDLTLVEANGNNEEGIEYEEDDDFAGGGDIVATLTGVKANGNGALDGDAGLKLREKGNGNLKATLIGIEASENVIGGVLLREDADGSLDATIRGAKTNGNDDDGIKYDENSTGDLTAVIDRATSQNNGDAGILLDQATAGVGTATVTNLVGGGNADGDVVAVNVTVTP